jgi:nucleoid-associated protein YejK
MSSGIGIASVVMNIDLKGCKLASQVDRYLFFLGAKRGHKVVDYYYYYFPTLTLGANPLGLILVIALLGMLDLNST